MKKVLLILVVALCATQVEAKIAICTGEYALCAASGSVPNGKKIIVDNKVYREGVAVCPVLTGTAVANLELMKGSCDAPKGMVWSLFGMPMPTTFPQAPDWVETTPVPRVFVVGDDKLNGMSNQWSFLCTKRPNPVNGVVLADCVGPINESPWTNGHVEKGSTAVTEAPVGTPNPVGGNFPNK